MRTARALAGLVIAAAAASAGAQNVSLSGTLGDKAVLVIDGAPRTLAAGGSAQGVKLLSAGAGEAVVELKGGHRVKLLMGGAQVNVGGAASPGGGTQIVLTAGSGGHFRTGGSINGKPVQFMVDTGATVIALGQADADRLGIAYRDAPRVALNTANGQVVARHVSLASVRIGDVQVYDVEATVVPLPMEMVLLGNSFLGRFQMKRENDVMTLTRRF